MRKNRCRPERKTNIYIHTHHKKEGKEVLIERKKEKSTQLEIRKGYGRHRTKKSEREPEREKSTESSGRGEVERHTPPLGGKTHATHAGRGPKKEKRRAGHADGKQKQRPLQTEKTEKLEANIR